MGWLDLKIMKFWSAECFGWCFGMALVGVEMFTLAAIGTHCDLKMAQVSIHPPLVLYGCLSVLVLLFPSLSIPPGLNLEHIFQKRAMRAYR